MRLITVSILVEDCDVPDIEDELHRWFNAGSVGSQWWSGPMVSSFPDSMTSDTIDPNTDF